MARTDFDSPNIIYSERNSVAELIAILKVIKDSHRSINEYPELKEILKDLLRNVGDNPNDVDGDISKIIKELDTLPVEIKDQNVEDVGKIIQTETNNVPINKLDNLKLKELVEIYEKEVDEKEKEKLLEEIAKKEKIEVKEVVRMIRRQQEIAREQAVLNELDLEKLNEKKEIERIEKTEKISKEEARVVLDEAKIAEAKLKVDNFENEITKNINGEENKSLIKNEIHRVVSGEKGKIEITNLVDPITAKTIEKQTEKWIKEHPETVRQNFLGEIKEEFSMAKANAETAEEKRQIEDYEKLLIKFHNVKSPQVLVDSSRKDVENKAESAQNSPGETKNAIYNADTTIKAAYHSPKDFLQIIEQAKGLANVSRKLLPNSAIVRSFDNLVAMTKDNPVVTKLQAAANLRVVTYEKIITIATKIPGVGGVVSSVSQTVGGVAIGKFLDSAVALMAKEGAIKGSVAILKAIAAGSTATAEAGGATPAVLSVLAGWQAIPVVGQIVIVVAAVIMAGMWIIDHIIKPFYNSLNNLLKNNLNINLGGVRDFVANDLDLGGFIGGVANIAFYAGGLMMAGLGFLFGPMLTMGLMGMTAIITPVIVAMTGIFIGYQFFMVQPMIGSLVPPPPMVAGTCKPKETLPNDGKINCNQNYTTDQTGASISKASFVDLANRWSPGGKNYANECYNDVVAQAKCAGLNPDYALWVWLHESGASNYGNFPDTSDFGVVYKPHNNFKEQITEFVKLNPASICINDPRVGGDYWLAFSINFLLGRDELDPSNSCNPDRADAAGNTGKTYAAELKSTWALIGALPSSIYSGTPDPRSCSTKPEDRKPNEYTAPDGTLMICDGPVDENGNLIGNNGDGSYDPNSPGLIGKKVAGECSVASKVIETRQCGQSWSNIGLPGGSGTICSAGCGPTSASSILQSKIGSLKPDKVIFEPGSPYSSMNGDGSSLGQAQQSLGKHGFTAGNLGSCTQDDIAAWICQGKAVMILTHSYTGTGNAYIGHILVAVAVSKGDIIVKDPYYSNSTPFVTKGEGNIKNLRQCLTITLGKD